MTEQATGPLAGVRVIDLTQYVLGPYATQTLGDLGCDVIKVEEPSGDRQRTSGRPPNSKTMGPVFVGLNRNKRSIALNLKAEPGRRALRKLIATADIFIHNMRPEALARLGFDYAAVSALKPDIVYGSAPGFGQSGPDPDGRPRVHQGLECLDGLQEARGEPRLRAPVGGADGTDDPLEPADRQRHQQDQHP